MISGIVSMNYKKTLRTIHLGSTIWFMVCVVYLLVVALHQAGFNWWIIFSLSGHLALLVMLLVSLYLFSMFRGAGDGFTMQIEHPLTSSMYYMAFYVSTPLLGAIAGLLGMIGETRIDALLGGIALGTIGATFLTWIVVDCVAGSAEMLTPRARKHRARRLADIRQRKLQEQTNREQLMAGALEQQDKDNRFWQQALSPQAEQLANLLACDDSSFSSAEQEAIRLGVQAWRMGGLNCMRQLSDMAMKVFRQQYNDGSTSLTIKEEPVDFISVWWDGVGTWRNLSVVSG
jgi:hypothetical protein